MIQLLDTINENESEEFHKNLVSQFLKDTYYKNNHFINTKGRNDLVIHNGNKAKSTVGVIIEAKKPTNKTEMLRKDKINTKALHELLLYYLRERITQKNLEIKYVVATNIYEWFIFDAGVFEKVFAENQALVKQFKDFEEERLSGTKTDFFYKEIAEPAIENIKDEIDFTWFDIREYEKPLRNNDKKDDNKLIALYKLLSPEHLLKLPFTNDSNTLDKSFYNELLHIIGLKETKEGSKKLIGRKPEGERDPGSFIENTITILKYEDCLSQIKASNYGHTKEEQLYNVALELVITWINRILFLKLLEGQLVKYQKGNSSFKFLNFERIPNYDKLNKLFFQVLAIKEQERNELVKKEFEKVPYLNSSLFEPNELEHKTVRISNLEDEYTLPLLSTTVLRDKTGKRQKGEKVTIEYLFRFLDAYDFAGEGAEDIQEDNKTLINASVLGLIFEKINGYKDGSFFTPGFITMYMARETIRRAVVQKFNEEKHWHCKDFNGLYDKIDNKKEANKIINSLKICDPAVGSGHFLVSALNEIIAIKSELKVLLDAGGKTLRDYHVEVQNDELIITDEDGQFFEYNPNSHESQRIQETLFYEKQTIIENCLFGVDINPNSVKICRLRLWIELLKNAYYKNDTELETLPNIDINIKCGNSLVSRFDIDADLKQALKKSKWTIDSYRVAVDTYRNAESKEQKREMERLIADIKSDFRSEISLNDPKVKRLRKLSGELFQMTQQQQLFEMSEKEKAAWNKKVAKLTQNTKKLETEIEEIKANKVFENAFEWRFEFPEVLNDDGDFVGFDVVIGNPPWGASLTKEQKKYLKVKYDKIDSSTPNTYAYFIGLSYQIGHSLITQILPDSILVKDFEKTRKLCSKSLYNLSWYQNTAIPDIVRPFLDVEHDVCTLFLDKTFNTEAANIYTRFYRNSKVIENEKTTKKENFILKEYDYTYNILLSSGHIVMLNKLRSYHTLNEFLQCHEGIHSGNIREKLFKKEKISGNEKPLFLGGRGGDKIENYISQRSGWFVDYRESIIDRSNGEYASLRDENIFNQPKIYLTRTGNPFKAFIDEANYASNNFFSIQFKDYSQNSYVKLLPILGLLNSKFANYYIRKIIAPSLGNTFVETKIIHLLKLPYNPILIEDENLIQTITYIIEVKNQDPTADTT
ncbi:MAG TPA: TaqI-like C-terminal specificity domain-containing protein, partial [Bacteroidales bacterium]|nr:TaqI-like C-terminal specificity domain-containing protein [Bacteroidales bacterium]